MPTPYVGVTGVVSPQEVEAVVNEFTSAGYSMTSPHIPMLGVLASFKSLNGQPTSRRYPKIELLPELMRAAAGRVLTMVHYNSREFGLCGQVNRVFKDLYKDGLCRALQLNIVWPDIYQVMLIKGDFPEMKIVFQANQQAMAGRTTLEIVNGIARYGSSLDYVLIDPSGGRGKEFSIDDSMEVYRELRESLPRLTVGFAGGFTRENVKAKVTELKTRTESTNFCTDAEGGLRDKKSDEKGDDVLSISKVRGYLQETKIILP